MRLKKGKLYRTIGGDVVRIIGILDENYGIFGEFLTHPNNIEFRTETWDDNSYPYLISHSTDDYDFALTDEEVTREEDPEYFL